MQATDDRSLQLGIRYIPWTAWLTGLGVITIVLLILFGTGMASTRTLICSRVESGQLNCLLRRSLLGFTVSQQQIAGLSGASVATYSRRVGTGSSHRVRTIYEVVLTTAASRIVLTPGDGSNSTHKEQIVKHINSFVADPTDPNLRTSYTQTTAIYWLLLVLIIGLFPSPLFTSSVSLELNAAAGVLTIRHWNLRGTRASSYPCATCEGQASCWAPKTA
jgi:hypothetical protein